MSPHTDAGAFTIRLEARPADDSHDWVEIYPAQLQWMAKEGNQVRAIEVAASHGSAGGEHDPADVFGEVDPEHRSLQGALAFGFAAALPKLTAAGTSLQNPQTSPERPDPAQAVRVPDLAHPERLKALSDAADYVEKIGARYHSGRDIANGIRCLGPQASTMPPAQSSAPCKHPNAKVWMYRDDDTWLLCPDCGSKWVEAPTVPSAAASPCNHQKANPNSICHVCQASHDLTAANALNRALRDAKRLLEANGYSVTSTEHS